MIRALIVLLFLGVSPVMAKNSPIIPQSKLGTVVPNDGDEYDKMMERLEAGDETVWDDLDKYAQRTNARREILKSAPSAPESKNAR